MTPLLPTRLLLVDDDASSLLALSEALRGRLLETVIDTAATSRSALALLRDHDYHAVVSDVRMAGLDGVAFLNQVRERWPDTPVVLMTGAAIEREAEALSSGAMAVLEKPVNVDRLLPILQIAMAQSLLRHSVSEESRESLRRLGFEVWRLDQKLFKPSSNDPSGSDEA